MSNLIRYFLFVGVNGRGGGYVHGRGRPQRRRQARLRRIRQDDALLLAHQD